MTQSSGKRYPKAVRREARRLYTLKREPWSLSDICGLPHMPNNLKVVRGWLVDQDVEIRPKQPYYPRREILAKLREGVPRAEIQEEYGCSLKYLSNLATGRSLLAKPKRKKKQKPKAKLDVKRKPRAKTKLAAKKQRNAKRKQPLKKKAKVKAKAKARSKAKKKRKKR